MKETTSNPSTESPSYLKRPRVLACRCIPFAILIAMVLAVFFSLTKSIKLFEKDGMVVEEHPEQTESRDRLRPRLFGQPPI